MSTTPRDDDREAGEPEAPGDALLGDAGGLSPDPDGIGDPGDVIGQQHDVGGLGADTRETVGRRRSVLG